MADDGTFTVESSRFDSVFALVSLCALSFACCWMLGNFAYHHETNLRTYAIFIAGLCLSGWGARLAYRRVSMPATLTFSDSSLTLSYAGHSSAWLWRDVETAYVVPLRRYPHVMLQFKPMHPSQIVPLGAELNHPFNVSANAIRDEILERIGTICERPASDAREVSDIAV